MADELDELLLYLDTWSASPSSQPQQQTGTVGLASGDPTSADFKIIHRPKPRRTMSPGIKPSYPVCAEPQPDDFSRPPRPAPRPPGQRSNDFGRRAGSLSQPQDAEQSIPRRFDHRPSGSESDIQFRPSHNTRWDLFTTTTTTSPPPTFLPPTRSFTAPSLPSNPSPKRTSSLPSRSNSISAPGLHHTMSTSSRPNYVRASLIRDPRNIKIFAEMQRDAAHAQPGDPLEAWIVRENAEDRRVERHLDELSEMHHSDDEMPQATDIVRRDTSTVQKDKMAEEDLAFWDAVREGRDVAASVLKGEGVGGGYAGRGNADEEMRQRHWRAMEDAEIAREDLDFYLMVRQQG